MYMCMATTGMMALMSTCYKVMFSIENEFKILYLLKKLPLWLEILKFVLYLNFRQLRGGLK